MIRIQDKIRIQDEARIEHELKLEILELNWEKDGWKIQEKDES